LFLFADSSLVDEDFPPSEIPYTRILQDRSKHLSISSLIQIDFAAFLFMFFGPSPMKTLLAHELLSGHRGEAVETYAECRLFPIHAFRLRSLAR
jgi:hypothetical protein